MITLAVRLRANEVAESVAIQVQDSGLGLSNTANLFVPFYTTKKSGSGVGLALVRQIAEAHGGSISLRNREDAPVASLNCFCRSICRLELKPVANLAINLAGIVVVKSAKGQAVVQQDPPVGDVERRH